MADLRVLTDAPVRLSPELAARTRLLPSLPDAWWERVLRKFGLPIWAYRSYALRTSWRLFRQSDRCEAVVTSGDLGGLAFAALLGLRWRRRPVHVMFDCLWYGGGWFKRAWMRFCLRGVDRCIVWASVECERFAKVYGVPRRKFLFVPHHDTMHARYYVEVGDDGYIFTGGNQDRDYALFLAAVRGLPAPCVLATNRKQNLAGLDIPANVRVVSASPSEFRQLMARAHLVVIPMQATLLHAGGQQTILNAMKMGKPVILTDPEGGVDYIENGRTGVLVPYGEAAALGSAIEHLLAHPEEARAMGRCAKAAASLMTTERCCNTIWNHALQLVEERMTANEVGASVGNGQSQEVG
jgi:glycosyltransferase involved in cell wall biosynthesis